MNAFLLKVKLILNCLERNTNVDKTSEFWRLDAKALEEQCNYVLVNFAIKVAIWNISLDSNLDLCKYIDDKNYKEQLDKFWDENLKGNTLSPQNLKFQFKVKKQMEIEVENLKPMANTKRNCFLFLFVIPEKTIIRGNKNNANTLFGELQNMLGIADELREKVEEKNGILRLWEFAANGD